MLSRTTKTPCLKFRCVSQVVSPTSLVEVLVEEKEASLPWEVVDLTKHHLNLEGDHLLGSVSESNLSRM